MAGEIVIKTRLDLEEFEKDLEKLDKVQINDKKIEITADLDSLKKTRTKIAKEIQKYEDKISELSSGVAKEKVMALPEFQEASAEIGKLKPQLEEVATAITSEEMKLQAINQYISQNPALQEEAKQEVEATTEAIKEETKAQEELNKKVDEYNQKKKPKILKDKKKDLEEKTDDIKDKTDGIGSSFLSIGTLIKGLALAGFVSALGQVAEKSETAKKQIEQISMVVSHLIEDLANLLLPIAEQIIDFIYQAVVYLGVLLEDWFGIDLFSARASDNLEKGVKSAKALRKQLMGFDEMNILNDSGGTGVLGGSGSSSKTKTKDPRAVAKEFKENIDNVVDEINNDFATQAGLTAREWILENIPGAKYIDEKIIEPIRRLLYSTGLFEPAEKEDIEKALGGRMLGAVAQKAVDNMQKKIKSQGFEKTFLEMALGTKQANEKTVDELLPVIDNFFNYNKKSSKSNKDTQKRDLNETKTATVNTFSNMQTVVGNTATKIQQNATTTAQKWMSTLTTTDTQGKTTYNNLWTYSKSFIDNITGNNGLPKVDKSSQDSANKTKTSWWTTATELIKKYTDKTSNGVVGAITGALNSISTTSEKDTKTALDKIKELINKFNPPKKSLQVTIDQKSLDSATKKIKEFFSKSFTITYKGTAGIVSGAIKSAKGSIINYPRLASGGIINRPGRGVMLASGGAIGGERGREAVIPLTNSGQMELLGQAIARNIVVNLTNEVKLDGKQLSRYISRVMQDTEFTSNGGVI